MCLEAGRAGLGRTVEHCALFQCLVVIAGHARRRDAAGGATGAVMHAVAPQVGAGVQPAHLLGEGRDAALRGHVEVVKGS